MVNSNCNHREKLKYSWISSGLNYFTSWIFTPHSRQHELACILPHCYFRHRNLLEHNEPFKVLPVFSLLQLFSSVHTRTIFWLDALYFQVKSWGMGISPVFPATQTHIGSHWVSGCPIAQHLWVHVVIYVRIGLRASCILEFHLLNLCMMPVTEKKQLSKTWW